MPVEAGLEPITIANGASLSSTSVHFHQQRLFGILMPASWTAAVLTFQGSLDGNNFFNVYDDTGAEVTVQAAASRFIVLSNPLLFLGLQRLMVRSGTSGAAVNQAADRQLLLVPQA